MEDRPHRGPSVPFLVARMTVSSTISADASDLSVVILVSRYHGDITSALEEGAKASFVAAGGDPSKLEIHDCPGAFELATLAGIAASTERFDAVVCLGCVVKGETSHDAWINGAVANEIAATSTRHGVPVAFGLLTVDDLDQARARAGGSRGNKGEESMQASIAAAGVARRLRAGGAS